jgi:hypothetical protein
MMATQTLQNLIARFTGAAHSQNSNAGDVALCMYGQPGELTFITTEIDRRSNHALAVIELTLPQGSKHIDMTCDQLHAVIRSYNENGADETPKAQILHYAATLAQAHDSSLHKPQDRARAPQSFL